MDVLRIAPLVRTSLYELHSKYLKLMGRQRGMLKMRLELVAPSNSSIDRISSSHLVFG